MTIFNQTAIERRVNDCVTRLTHDFDLGWMKFTNAFDSRADGDRIVCETICDFEYRQATFRWNYHLVSTMDDDDLEETAVHEIVHCLNAPTWESLPGKYQSSLAKLNELSTENLSRVITHLYKGATP